MAFNKEITLKSGVVGNYWKITQRNSNFNRVDDVVTLQLYINNDYKAFELTPLNKSIQFNFCKEDHPLTDFDLDTVDVNKCVDLYDLELHVRYTHIKNIAIIANNIILGTKKEEEPILTPNEEKAIWFVDSLNI